VRRLAGLAVMAGGAVAGLGWYLLDDGTPLGPPLSFLGAGLLLAAMGAVGVTRDGRRPC
jgi:hypothetical protein